MEDKYVQPDIALTHDQLLEICVSLMKVDRHYIVELGHF
jgi:hypothetical protein